MGVAFLRVQGSYDFRFRLALKVAFRLGGQVSVSAVRYLTTT